MTNTKQQNESYMQSITEKCISGYNKTEDPNWLKTCNQTGEEEDTTKVPTTKTYFLLLERNYTSVQLRSFAKLRKLKIAGTKKEITARLFAHLYFSSFVTKIQKIIRGTMVRTLNNEFHGPACFKRSLCVNGTDFLTMEDIKDIDPKQFFSYMDTDNFIYGFDAVSLHNLITSTTEDKLCNPYNRNKIPQEALARFKTMLRVGKKLKIGINTDLEPVVQTQEEELKFRVLDLFQYINGLGNYSDPEWFMVLDKYRLIRMMRELFDIWHYRLQITTQTKCAICPPHGSPFSQFSVNMLRDEMNPIKVKHLVLNVLFKMVTTGIDRDSKCLGAYYVLGALTLVNTNAATALPWLYQSVSFHSTNF